MDLEERGLKSRILHIVAMVFPAAREMFVARVISSRIQLFFTSFLALISSVLGYSQSVMKVILQSNDNEEFEVDRDVIRLSTTLNTMFQDLGMDDPDAGETLNDPIPLANVNGAILRKVIQWCQYHKDDPPTANDSDNKVSSEMVTN